MGGGLFSFLPNLRQADSIFLFYAALGGFIFNIANVLLVAGIEMVAWPLPFRSLSASPSLKARPQLSHPPARQRQAACRRCVDGAGRGRLHRNGLRHARNRLGGQLAQGTWSASSPDCSWRLRSAHHQSHAGQPSGCIAAGPVGALSPYTAAVLMTFGAFFCCFVFNPILMRKPLAGAPVSISGYFSAPAGYHALACWAAPSGARARSSTSLPHASSACPSRMLLGRPRP